MQCIVYTTTPKSTDTNDQRRADMYFFKFATDGQTFSVCPRHKNFKIFVYVGKYF